MEIGVKTDIGKVRDRNQDAYFVSSSEEPPLFIIADGMGGHKAGETASNMAIEITSTQLVKGLRQSTLSDDEIQKNIEGSIDMANREIYRKSLSDESLSGMGTTTTIAYINDGKVHIGHVGDSRAYILRENTLCQITNDHSLVEELIRNGSISAEEAKNHPQRNIITRAVGTNEYIEVDLVIKKIYRGDILLLCSDGLSNMLGDDEIREILLGSTDMKEASQNLVELSKDRGGFDNITVLIVKF
ncbi:MAG: Stp1/IreP family PP2C-type Ser/Thr phosphatase [Tissierellia bacterium]|nr:Stp1/IreP family PP2C-type Ser/Thr phosphatase [Tissierellia bacterium]